MENVGERDRAMEKKKIEVKSTFRWEGNLVDFLGKRKGLEATPSEPLVGIEKGP